MRSPPAPCVATFDNLHTLRRTTFRHQITRLSADKMADACQKQVFFIVGGGGAFDNTGERSRLEGAGVEERTQRRQSGIQPDEGLTA